jgi:hypothetical protein
MIDATHLGLRACAINEIGWRAALACRAGVHTAGGQTMQSDPRQRQPGVEEAEPVDADPAGSVQQSTPDPSVLPEPVDAEDQDASSDVERQ